MPPLVPVDVDERLRLGRQARVAAYFPSCGCQSLVEAERSMEKDYHPGADYPSRHGLPCSRPCSTVVLYLSTIIVKQSEAVIRLSIRSAVGISHCLVSSSGSKKNISKCLGLIPFAQIPREKICYPNSQSRGDTSHGSGRVSPTTM